MCHSHRSACSYLAFEQWDYAAVAAQHVAEAHCHEARLLCSAVHLLDYHLTETLGRSHDIRRVHRFVGGYQDESADAVLCRCFCCDVGAQHVVLDGLVGTALH